MNAQMNASFAVVRNSRTSANDPWTRNYLGIYSYRKYRNLQKSADDANSVLSLEDRQKGGIVGYVGIAVNTLEGGIDGMALRTWIQGTTGGKAYDVKTAKLLNPELVQPVDQTPSTKALHEIRKLLNDMPPGGFLCNEMLIRNRLEAIHDTLAKAVDSRTWQSLWTNEYPPTFA